VDDMEDGGQLLISHRNGTVFVSLTPASILSRWSPGLQGALGIIMGTDPILERGRRRLLEAIGGVCRRYIAWQCQLLRGSKALSIAIRSTDRSRSTQQSG
jgi:hypothetical protein